MHEGQVSALYQQKVPMKPVCVSVCVEDSLWFVLAHL